MAIGADQGDRVSGDDVGLSVIVYAAGFFMLLTRICT